MALLPFSKSKELNGNKGQGMKRERPPFQFKSLKGTSIVFSIVGIIFALGIFAALVFLQNYFSRQITYNKVVFAKTDIPERTIITPKNFNEFFELKDVDVLAMPEKVCVDANELIGTVARIEITKGEIVTMKDFEDSSQYSSLINDPVEVSLRIDDISSTLAGKIRAGDMVNVTVMSDLSSFGGMGYVEDNWDEGETSNIGTGVDTIETVTETEDAETNETKNNDSVSDDSIPQSTGAKELTNGITFPMVNLYVMKNIYITRAYTAEGELIQPGDVTTNAGILVFTIEREDEVGFNNAISNCTNIRISKVMDKGVKTADGKSAVVSKTFNTPEGQEQLRELQEMRQQEDLGNTSVDEYVTETDNTSDIETNEEETEEEQQPDESEEVVEETPEDNVEIEGESDDENTELTPISDSEDILNQIEEGLDQ